MHKTDLLFCSAVACGFALAVMAYASIFDSLL